ncbi:MAG TPA: TIGR01906 family membrane protein [Aggregatilineales bacterium]|nr:TIGR01906 family membrane protein [Aggregatilineales bacterium]
MTNPPGMTVASPRLTGWIVNALSVLVTLTVPIVLVLLGVHVVMSDSYLQIEYNKPDFPADSYGFSLQDRLQYAPYALDYMLGPYPIDYLGNQTLPNGAPMYNERELQHMQDVKVVFRATLFLLAAALFVLALCILLLREMDGGRAALRRGLYSGGLLMLAILALLVVFVLSDWNSFFDGFHNLFFAQGTWRFEYSDTLIRLFPERFWQDAALTIGALSALGALLILVGCWRWAKLSVKHA